ncbi:hypothetical protein SNEBB_003188 [Seison nebaliae]|nr:hypothetical protein SNEBB_003188 [Seison nebaliae]
MEEIIVHFVPTKTFSVIIPNIQCYALKCTKLKRCLGFNNSITGSFITSLTDLNDNMFIRKEYFPLILKLGQLHIVRQKVLFANITNFAAYNAAQYDEGFNQDNNYFLGLSIVQSMAEEKPICLKVIFNYYISYDKQNKHTRIAKNCGCYFDLENRLKVGVEQHNSFRNGNLTQCTTAGRKAMDGSVFQKTAISPTAFWGDCFFSYSHFIATGYQIYLYYNIRF